MQMEFSGFDWDGGNRAKCEKHGVRAATIESLFTRPLAVLPDEAHSRMEPRFRAVGRSETGRLVFVVFTMRHGRIRPISARYMHAKEAREYEKENPQLQKR
jgi:hypothetical protein